MIDIKGLKCPNCGANISDTGTVCNYCGCRIVLSDDGMKLAPVGVLCPDCGENNGQTERFCNKCGTALLRNCHSCDEGIPTKSEHCPSSGNDDNSFQREEVVRELAELERANCLLITKLDKAESPGGLIAPTIISMFAAGGICVYVDSGEAIGLLTFALLALPSIGLFWHHFFGRKQEISGIQNEIVKVQQKMAVRKKEALEIG
jgi:hypothetical protein